MLIGVDAIDIPGAAAEFNTIIAFIEPIDTPLVFVASPAHRPPNTPECPVTHAPQDVISSSTSSLQSLSCTTRCCIMDSMAAGRKLSRTKYPPAPELIDSSAHAWK